MGPVAGAQQIYQLKGALWVGGGWEKVALVWQPPLFLDVSLYAHLFSFSITFKIWNQEVLGMTWQFWFLGYVRL